MRRFVVAQANRAGGQAFERVGHIVQQRGAVIGEEHAAGLTLEERHAEPIFQQPNLFAHCPVSDMELGCCGSEAAVASYGLEVAQRIERGQPVTGRVQSGWFDRHDVTLSPR